MPSISQLPPAREVSPDDEVPISQGGSACAVALGDLLASAQPVIQLPSPSLLGRTSIGSGGPEGVALGAGIAMSNGAIIATGADHAAFSGSSTLIASADLVVSDQGMPRLMPTASLRNLFSAGANVSIDASGVISASGSGGGGEGGLSVGAIAALQRTGSLSANDVVPVSQAGTTYGVSYSNFLSGLTIDQASSAGAVSDTDSLWVAQGSNAMVSQTFGAIWSWASSRLLAYRMPIVEVTSSVVLNFSAHNGRLIVATGANVSVTPNVALMGSGFACEIMTAPGASIAWGTGIVATDAGTGLGGNAHARLLVCASSAGTLILAVVGAGSSSGPGVVMVPGPVTGLALIGSTTSSLTLTWTPAATGGLPTYFAVQYRVSGAASWTTWLPNPAAPAVTISSLAAGTTYDVQVAAGNSAGVCANYAQLMTLSTATPALVAPGAPASLSVGAVTSSTVALTWSAPASGGAASGYVVQCSSNGGTTWSSPVSFGNTGAGVMAGLSASTTYSFRVAALNAAGSGPYTPQSSYPAATTASANLVPGIPTGVTFPVSYNTSVVVQWTVPGGTVTGYNLQYRVVNAPAWTVIFTTSNSVMITGLMVNTGYEFQVQSVNGTLTSAYSASAFNTTSATNAGIFKLTPAPTRQSPSQGWVGTTITMASGQPSAGYNVSDNSATSDGAFPVPASVGFAWSTSNTVVPAISNAGTSGLSLDGHNLWYTWSVSYPSSAGNYYLWAIARDSAGNIGGTCVSPTPFALR